MKLTENILQALKSGKIQFEDLDDRYFIATYIDVEVEVENILKLLNENICSFQEIVDKFKSIKDYDNHSSLYMLFWNEELFEELIENNKLNTEDLRYLLNKIDNRSELCSLNRNTILLEHTVENGLFQEAVAEYKKFGELDLLLQNKELFEEVVENNRLNKEDLKYLLNRIDRPVELYDLSHNTLLIKYVLNEFVLNKETADRFNTIIENDKDCEKYSIHTIFDYIEFYATRKWDSEEDECCRKSEIDQELLDLNELNKKIYSFDLNENQRDELIEVLRNSEVAKNRLIAVVDYHLESNYEFDSLMNYLKKVEKRVSSIFKGGSL